VVGGGNASSRVEVRRLTGHAVRADAGGDGGGGLSPGAVCGAALGLVVLLLVMLRGQCQAT